MKKHLFNGLFVATLLGVLTQTAGASFVPPTPDVAQTSVLLAVAFGGLTFVRRFIR